MHLLIGAQTTRLMMEKLATITKYSHHFVVENVSPTIKLLCEAFCKPLIAWRFESSYGVTYRVADKVYAASDASRCYFRFHIHQFDSFLEFLYEKGIIPKNLNIIEYIPYEPFKCDLQLRQGWVANEDQIHHVDYLVNSKYPIRLLTRQTGTGKTFVSLAACAQIKQRIAIVVKPMYMQKWYNDVRTILDVEQDDVLMVAGTSALKMLIIKAKQGLIDEKIIIISLPTFQNWVSAVEDTGPATIEEGYECWPWEFFETLKVGVRIIDEAHQRFYEVFKTDLYSNVCASISLSATLISRDALITRMYNVLFPAHVRVKDNDLIKHANAIALHFNFEKPEKIRTTEYGRKNYSHNAVEQSILKHVPTTLNYFRLIKGVVDVGYIAHPRKKKKLLIFAFTKNMCTKIVEYLKRHYPYLDIRRYVDGDPYENVIDADIRVSTIGSCGAAIDIPDLVCVINTHNIDSIQANIQAFGRLRPLKGGTVEENSTCYYYLIADNISKYVSYDNERKVLLKERALTVRDINAGMSV